jgi:predicted membrane protein
MTEIVFTISVEIRHPIANIGTLSLRAKSMTLHEALFGVATRPVDLVVRRWNWKAAFFSSLVRGIIFLVANLAARWRAAAGAMLAEWLYRALTSGFYGAITQALGEADPEWHGAVAAMILLPVSSHSIEFLVHWLRHTPHLKASIISSMSFTVISTLFNFYAMRRGRWSWASTVHLSTRTCENMCDILEDDPKHALGWVRWSDRVF